MMIINQLNLKKTIKNQIKVTKMKKKKTMKIIMNKNSKYIIH